MANDALVAALKAVVALAKAGKNDEAFAAYAELFSSAPFTTYAHAEQRQALKLMVLAKGIPTFLPPPMEAAHKAALPTLRALVAAENDPGDHEMLGLCLARTGDTAGAQATFKAGLDLERARDAQSDLCGRLMKWVASV
jgi:tetratricopeptide (TPR) repeat protein